MKKTLSVLSLSAILGAMLPAAPVWAAVQAVQPNQSAAAPAAAVLPEIAATAYVVKDLQSNQILAQKGLDQRVEPASLTKLMTAYLAFKALESGKLKPDQLLQVSNKAWKAEGSRMFLDPAKQVRVDDLLKGLIVQSGNDAAITLAEAIGGSEEQFAVLMNEEAKRLGMTQTHFKNSTGLPDAEHLTSVNDLVVLAGAIIRDYPKYYPIYSLKSFSYNNITQPNRNLLLYRDADVDGLKTGHTASAGYNLVASSKRNGRRVVSVVVGTESPEARAAESSKLLNYALQNFDTVKLYAANQAVGKIEVYKGSENEVEAGFLNDVYLTLPHSAGRNIQPVLQKQQPVLAPIAKGQVLGTLQLLENGKIIGEKKVVALQAVEEAGLLGRMWDSICLWFKQIFAD